MTEPTTTPITTRVSTGELRGTRENGVDRYLGIPCAAAPVGGLRFADPAPAPPWSGVRDATVMGPTSPQNEMSPNSRKYLPNVIIPGYDYLNVNVWTPEGAGNSRSWCGSTAARSNTGRTRSTATTARAQLGALEAPAAAAVPDRGPLRARHPGCGVDTPGLSRLSLAPGGDDRARPCHVRRRRRRSRQPSAPASARCRSCSSSARCDRSRRRSRQARTA